MEEEGGFGIYGEKTRYATLQKAKHDNPGSNNRGYETLRHFRSNIPSLVNILRIFFLIDHSHNCYARLEQIPISYYELLHHIR
jgi:hypothetical protein